jgi:peptide/nickel transport system substrate-binding protein
MTRKINVVLWVLTLFTILSMLATACGPGTPTAAPEVEEPEVEEPKVEEPEEVEIIGGYAQPEDFLTLDPSVTMAQGMIIQVNVYEGLTYTPEYDTQIAEPLLATSWEANEDGTVWTFHLREGVKFHDGTDFTAEAVKYSYERTLRMGLGGAYILEPIEEIVIIDDYTVQFNLQWPAPMDIIAASAYAAWIMSPTTVEKEASDTEDWFNLGNDAGTGPYMIESYERGRRVILKKFEDYWAGWVPGSFDRVFYDIVEDPIVLQQLIESGETDFTWGIPPENRPILEARDDVNRVEEKTFIVHYIPINTQHPPLDNKLVRQALAYTFPYQDLIEVILDGFGIQPVSTVPEGAWGRCDDCFMYSHDLDKARELLTLAGYPDGGFDLEIVVWAGFGTTEQYAELWKAELAKVGINLTITPMITEAAYERARSSPEEAADLLGFSWWQDIVHPFAFMQLEWMCEEEIFFNFSYWCNEEFDALVLDGFSVSASDREESVRMYEEAQAILIEEVPSIFLYQEIKNWYVRSDVKGFVPNPAYTAAVYWKFLTRSQ